MAVFRFADLGGYRALDVEQCREAGKRPRPGSADKRGWSILLHHLKA